MQKLYTPWSLPATFNGRHPLVASLVDDPALGATILAPRNDFNYDPDVRRTVGEFARFAARLADHFAGHPVVRTEHIDEFVRSRDVLTQLVRPADAELTFLHTVPNTHGQTPWLIHIELPVNLFMPFVWQGRTAALSLRKLPVYWMVRYMLEQPECRAVFSHLKQTADGLGALFDSEIIAGKTHHIPLGVLTTPAQEAAIESAIAARRQEEVTLLFTNSYHQLPENFVLRGGVDVVTAFLAASKHAENLRLVLRSSLPDMLGPELLRVIRSHPRIELVDAKISDEELFKLYCRAQIFLVPGAALHAMSVARAMHCGLVCIASDAPGYEEYIEDETTGLMLRGRRAAVYAPEPETGWMRDDYAPMFRPNPAYAADLASLLIHLAQSEQARQHIGGNARIWAKQHLAQSVSASAFRDMLGRLQV